MRCCSIKVLMTCLALSMILLAISLVLMLKVFKDLINDGLNKEVRLENGTKALDRFLKLPLSENFNVYIFHITNPYDILQGKKPILQEKGPYVYSENITRTIESEDKDKDTIDYTQTATFTFNQKASGELTEDDIVTVVNPPLVVMYTYGEPIPLIDRSCFLQNFEKGQKGIFSNFTIKKLLFDGFTLCNTKSSFLCSAVNTGACAIAKLIKFIDKNDNDNSLRFSFFNYRRGHKKDVFTMRRGLKNLNTMGTIIKWNQRNYTDYWGVDTECDFVNGCDSTLYPPRITKDDTFNIFSTDICRSVKIKYNGTGHYKGIEGYYFSIDENVFQSPYNEHTKDCYCTERTLAPDGQNYCYLDGTIDLQTCTGVPVVLSLPHFLGAEKYQKDVDGLSPNFTKHQTYVLLEPNTGIPLEGYKRIQLSTVLRPFKNVKETASVKPLILPLFWVEEGASLTDELVDELNDKYFNKLKLVDGIQYGLLGLSLTLITIFTVSIIVVVCRSRQKVA